MARILLRRIYSGLCKGVRGFCEGGFDLFFGILLERVLILLFEIF